MARAICPILTAIVLAMGLHVLAWPLAIGSAARAETVVAALSTQRILIESNFSGGIVTIFGSVMDAPAANTNYDAVVTVRGPRGAVTVRRKQKWGPFWLNLDNRKYIGIPAFIAVLSNRNFRQIAAAEVRDDLRIGIDSLIPPQVARRGANDPEFRAALQRLRENEELFYEDDTNLKFISPRVFTANVSLPGSVPLGKYDVDIAVFSGGALQSRQTLTFEVTKTATEQAIAYAAHEYPIAYGLLVAFIALFLGWIASVIFRRD